MVEELFAGKYRTDSMRLQGWDYTSDGMYFITICTRGKEWRFGKVENGRMVLNDIGNIVRDEWIKTGDVRKNVVLGEWVVMPDHFHAIIAIRSQPPYVETSRRDVSEKWPGDRSIGLKSPGMSYRDDLKTAAEDVPGSNPVSETPQRDGLKTGPGNAPGSNPLSETPQRDDLKTGAENVSGSNPVSETPQRDDLKTGPGNAPGSNPLSETPQRDDLKTGAENVPGSNPVSETPQRGVSTRMTTAGLKPGSLGAIIGQFKSIVTKRIEKDGNNDFAWQPGYYDHIIRNDRDLERIREYIILNPERFDAGRG